MEISSIKPFIEKLFKEKDKSNLNRLIIRGVSDDNFDMIYNTDTVTESLSIEVERNEEGKYNDIKDENQSPSPASHPMLAGSLPERKEKGAIPLKERHPLCAVRPAYLPIFISILPFSAFFSFGILTVRIPFALSAVMAS